MREGSLVTTKRSSWSQKSVSWRRRWSRLLRIVQVEVVADVLERCRIQQPSILPKAMRVPAVLAVDAKRDSVLLRAGQTLNQEDPAASGPYQLSVRKINANLA